MSKWPKQIPELTDEEKQIKNESMLKWHEEQLPHKYGFMEKFNDEYPVKRFKKGPKKKKHWNTLEIGGGTGNHISSEDMTNQDYTVLDIRENMLMSLKEKYPEIRVVKGDCQKRYAKRAEYDRIICIHTLEHIPNLPEALKQIRYALKPDGVAHIVIPCEGGWLYYLGRQITIARWFKNNYHRDYGKFIKSEHLNTASEVIEELSKYFKIKEKTYFPFCVHLLHANISIGLTLYQKEGAGNEFVN